MAYPPISALPSPPSRQDPANFADEADAFLGALPTFQSQVNAAGVFIEGKAVTVGNNFVGNYSAGTTYSIGQSVLYTDDLFYISLVNSNVGNTPDISPSQWFPVPDVSLANYTGNATINGELIATSYNETFVAVTSTSNAVTVNCEAGNSFSHTLTENTTFTFSNPPTTGTAYGFTLKIVQDAGASGYTVTWPTSVDWPSATAPTLTATASAVDVFVFYTHDGGTTFYGFVAGLGLATPA